MKQTMILFMLFAALAAKASGIDPIIPQQAMNNEYLVKLAMIEKFTMYIEWPKQARLNADTSSNFFFGIYGDISPFGDDLIKLKNERTLKWRKVTIRFYEKPEDIVLFPPDLLFVPREYDKFMEKVVATVTDLPVVVIGDVKGDVKKGALFDLYVDNENVKLEANRERMVKCGLKVSSELLRLAD